MQPDRVKPELRNLSFTLNMDMWRFIAVPCVKEETVGTDPQYCWHPASRLQHLTTHRATLVYTLIEPKIKGRDRTPGRGSQHAIGRSAIADRCPAGNLT